MGKVVTRGQIDHELSLIRNRGQRVVFTNGCFDILHLGHVTYLKQARALGDFLFIGLNSDTSVSKLKGPERPVQCESDRAEILASLEAVSFVCIFSEETPLELIKMVNPQVLVKGGDWSIEKIVGASFVTTNGGVVKSLPFVGGKSTTGIVEKILKL